MNRTVSVKRQTKETDIELMLCLDGGACDVQTGIGFFDHMLGAFALHGGFGLALKAEGDLHVDAHHTVEDVGIVLGTAFKQALGDKKGIARFGNAYVPMDEALAFAAADISGRAYLVLDGEIPAEMLGTYPTVLNEEFFRAFAYNAGITLHLRALYGKNAHHMTEALFKAAARALREAVRMDGDSISSTKGVL